MTPEYDQSQKLQISDNLFDSVRFSNLLDGEYFWGGPGEVLQGIMDTRMGPPAVPMDPPPDNIRDISGFPAKSSASPLFGQLRNSVPDSVVDSRNHASILPPWPPCQSPSPKNSGGSFPSYTTRLSYNNQDAWSALQVTGVPGNASVLGSHGLYKQQTHDPHRRYSYYQFGTSADPEIQFHGFPPSDSGYGTRSAATRSVISSFCPIESASTPRQVKAAQQSSHAIDPAVPHDVGQSQELVQAPVDLTEPLPRTCHEEIKCGYPGCGWKGKCPSDKRKHEARHKKLHKCDVPNCARKEGFGTINDLERHKKCVHNKEPGRGPKILYMCFGYNCQRRSKQWPRLDNFRQHLARVHPDEDASQLLKRSEEWYHHWKGSQDASRLLVEPFPPSPLSSNQHLSSYAQMGLHESNNGSNDAYRSTCNVVAPGETVMNTEDVLGPSESLTLSPIKNMGSFDQRTDQVSHSETPQDVSQQSLAEQHPVALPGLKSLNLPLEKEGKNLQSIPSSMNRGRQNDIVAEAAMNVVDAMTRLMDTSPRKKSHPETSKAKTPGAEGTASLQDRKKEMLQRILSAALEHLGAPSPDSAATEVSVPVTETDNERRFECSVCHKRTRLLCELKKHMKRHEKPYGCTFTKCYKEFGSKADWKRHENSQHFHLQSWRCTLPDTTHKTLECARLFYRQESYVQHLTDEHKIQDEEIKPWLSKNRLGRNGQTQFWCGFCRKIIPLKLQGLEAWNERFNHIDIEHFKRGEKIGSWVLPTGRSTKDEEKEKEERDRNRPTFDEHGSNSSGSSRSSSDPDDIPEKSSHPTATDDVQDAYSHHGREGSVEYLGSDLPEAFQPVHNDRKRKFNLSTSSTAPKKSRPGPSRQLTNSAGPIKTRNTSDKARRETAASLFYARYPRTEQYKTDLRYCCQCHQGPCATEVTNRCVSCTHDFCDACISFPIPEEAWRE